MIPNVYLTHNRTQLKEKIQKLFKNTENQWRLQKGKPHIPCLIKNQIRIIGL